MDIERDIDRHIGRQLRRRRKLAGLTLDQVARGCGVRFQQIQKYESGVSRLSAGRLWRLTQVLNVSPSYFFEGLGFASDRPGCRSRALSE